MNISQYIIKHRPFGAGGLVPRIVCKDGFSMSVQAGKYYYCTPREEHPQAWDEVECGFPSEKESSLMEYAECPDTPTDTVYGYVPVQVVEEIIERHGGIVE